MWKLPYNNLDKKRSYVCKKCGQGGLIWKTKDGGWKLFHKDDIAHTCGKNSSLDQQSAKAKQINSIPAQPPASVTRFIDL